MTVLRTWSEQWVPLTVEDIRALTEGDQVRVVVDNFGEKISTIGPVRIPKSEGSRLVGDELLAYSTASVVVTKEHCETCRCESAEVEHTWHLNRKVLEIWKVREQG